MCEGTRPGGRVGEAVVSCSVWRMPPDVDDGTCQGPSVWPVLEFEGILSWPCGLGRKPIS